MVVGVVILALSITTPLAADDGSTTTLTLKPDTIKVPYLSSDRVFGAFYIDAYLSNVQDLKWFKLNVIFDGDILEPMGRATDPEWTGGLTCSGGFGHESFHIRWCEPHKIVSGSGVLLRFWFKPKAVGTTKVEFWGVQLKDVNGNLIPCTCIGNQVEVVPFETWVDGDTRSCKRNTLIWRRSTTL